MEVDSGVAGGAARSQEGEWVEGQAPDQPNPPAIVAFSSPMSVTSSARARPIKSEIKRAQFREASARRQALWQTQVTPFSYGIMSRAPSFGMSV